MYTKVFADGLISHNSRKPPDSAPPVLAEPAAPKQPPVTQPASNARPRPRRWLRRLIIGTVSIVVIIAVGVALLPAFLSSRTGRHWLLTRINAQLAGQVQASDLSVSWSGPVQAADVHVLDPGGHE